jgi:hypothetical protein
MTRLKSLSTLLVLALIGCGEPQVAHTKQTESSAMLKAAAHAELMPAPSSPAAPAGAVDSSKIMFVDGSVTMLAATQPGTTAAPAGSAAISRKIIYDGQIDLVVDSVDPVAKKVATFVQNARGFIAELNVTGSPGSLRSMRWRFRVPVEQFDSFVDSILSLGDLERNNRTSQDVTEQYYDIEARIKNKKVEEQTLNKILQERSGKLEDVLKIEIELSRVRGEIEQLEGKIRVLENLSSLATLTLNVRERDKYAPPPPVVADFPTQMARVWNTSLLGLVNLGKSLVLWAVSWVLWIPFLLLGAVVAWLLVRWLIRVFLRNLPRMVALARTPLTGPRAPTPGA